MRSAGSIGDGHGLRCRGDGVVEQIELAVRAVNDCGPAQFGAATPAPARPCRRRRCRPRRSSRHPPPYELRQQPHPDEHRPQRPRHPHGASALGQRPRRGRRQPAAACWTSAPASCPRSSARSRIRAARAAAARPSRAARRRGRCRTRPAPPWPSRRRSWRGAPARRPPTRTPRSRPARPPHRVGQHGQQADLGDEVGVHDRRGVRRRPSRRGPGRRGCRTPAPRCRSGRARRRSTSTSGAWDARSSASNSRTCTAAAPAARTAATSLGRACRRGGRPAPRSRPAPAACASSTPDLAAAAENHDQLRRPCPSRLRLCPALAWEPDGEGNHPAHQRRAGVSHRTSSGHVDDAALGQFAARGGGRFHLRPEDAHRPGHHHGRLAEGGQRRGTRRRGAQPGRRRPLAVAGGQGHASTPRPRRSATPNCATPSATARRGSTPSAW